MATLAVAEHTDVENILAVAGPFSSRKTVEGGKSAAERRDIRNVWITGRPAMSEATAAKVMVNEAIDLQQSDLGLHAVTAT